LVVKLLIMLNWKAAERKNCQCTVRHSVIIVEGTVGSYSELSTPDFRTRIETGPFRMRIRVPFEVQLQ
jgi:hypothetical protein